MNLTTPEALIVVFLFALALGGFLWTAWQPGQMTRRRILLHMAFVALVAIDTTVLVAIP